MYVSLLFYYLVVLLFVCNVPLLFLLLGPLDLSDWGKKAISWHLVNHVFSRERLAKAITLSFLRSDVKNPNRG